MANRVKSAGDEATSPQSLPSSPPPYTAHNDHSFTLQAVMELTKCTGHLTSAVEGLRRDIEAQSKAIGDFRADIIAIKMKIYAAGVLLFVLVSIGGFIVNKAWDLLAKQITITAAASSKQTEP